MQVLDQLKEQKELFDKATRNLDSAILQCFSTSHGQQVLAYLRHITLYKVAQAGSDGMVLSYREGQRALVADLLTRMENAKNGKG